MLKVHSIQQKPVLLIAALSLLLGAAGFYACLHDFYLVFLIPVAFAILFYGLLNTEKLLLLTGAIAPLSINENDIGGGLGISLPTEPLILILLALLIFRFFQNRNADLELLKHPLSLAVLSYMVWLFVSTAFSSMPLVSFKSAVARSWYILPFYFGCASIFQNGNRIHFFLKALTFFTLVLVIYTLSKHAADGFVRSSSYGISWPFFPDHGMYAAAIAFLVPVLAFYAFNGRAFGFKLFWLPVAGFFLIVLLFGIVVSYTRATWLSLVAAMGVYLLLQFRIKFVWVMLALLVVSVAGVLKQDQILYGLEANKQGSSDELEGHIKSVSNITTDPSNMERINRWKCAMRMVAARPLTGFGPGTYAFQYGVYQKSSELTIISTNAGDVGDAHSEYFSALSELGIPGFIAWISIVLLSMSTGFRVYYNSQNRQVKITVMMALLGLVTYYTHALLNNYCQFDKIAVPMWSFMAIIAALDLIQRRQQQGEVQA